MLEAASHASDKVQTAQVKFSDLEELKEFQQRKRTEFENYIRRNAQSLKNWFQYGEFELSNREYARMRSVMERMLDAGHTQSVPAWLRYIEMEMKTANINHARNLLDRSVVLLPRETKLWYKFVHMEEMLGNVPAVRAIFDRWIQWQEPEAFLALAKFEQRYHEWDFARIALTKLAFVHAEPQNYQRLARFEEEHGAPDAVREVYQSAIESLGDELFDEGIILAYSRFEIKQQEYERTQFLFKYFLDKLPRSKTRKLQEAYTKFTKQYASTEGLEDAILSKRRARYAEQLRESPKNYDIWIDATRLEESAGDTDRACELYERAVAQVPPSQDKRHWRRYLYLFAFYGIYLELTVKDVTKARQLWSKALQLIPHTRWTSAKIWLLAAECALRNEGPTAMRKMLGQALGRCPKPKLYKAYIQKELALFDFARARQLYQQFISFDAANCQAWIKFAELERGLDDADRARAILELGTDQELDQPEMLWKSYIDFEIDEGEVTKARTLYERLLQKTDHVKVWISYAQFEISADLGEDEDENEDESSETTRPITPEAKSRARAIFKRAYSRLKEQGLTDERVTLLNAHKGFETLHGGEEDVAAVEKKMPRRVKKRRRLDEGEFEEYLTWAFPDDEDANPKVLEMMRRAQEWKRAQAAAAAAAVANEGSDVKDEVDKDGE